MGASAARAIAVQPDHLASRVLMDMMVLMASLVNQEIVAHQLHLRQN